MAAVRVPVLASRGLRLTPFTQASCLPGSSQLAMLSLPQAVAAACRAPRVRPFGSSCAVLKKRTIAVPANSPQRQPVQSLDDPDAPAAPTLSLEDPLDISALEKAFEVLDAHFKMQMMSIVQGGRFNPAVIGNLRVAVEPEDGGETAYYPLRQLAHIVVRSSRAISLFVNDRAYIKPIMSAVQASPNFNQQPQRAADNDLELLLVVEVDRREDLIKRIREAAQDWKSRTRRARSRLDRLVQDWQQSGKMGPDLARRVNRKLQKSQDKKIKEIKDEESLSIKKLYNKIK